MKFLYKFIILGLTGLFLSGCSLVPTAWRSSRPAGGEQAPVVTAEPSQTLTEFDESVSADLEAPLEADLDKIEEELKAIDEEVKNY